MTKFYFPAAIVVLSVCLFLGASWPGGQQNFQFRQNLDRLQQDQQIDQLRREQEQNQLQQQLNDLPHQPGEGAERREQLNDLQQHLDQLQLERQQNQLRQEQQLDQLRQEEQLNQPQGRQQFDQLQHEQQLQQLQQQQQIDQLREQQQRLQSATITESLAVVESRSSKERLCPNPIRKFASFLIETWAMISTTCGSTGSILWHDDAVVIPAIFSDASCAWPFPSVPAVMVNSDEKSRSSQVDISAAVDKQSRVLSSHSDRNHRTSSDTLPFLTFL